MSTEERTAEEWGRVAVSLPGWRWMPGMGLLPLPNLVEQHCRDGEAVGSCRYAGQTRNGSTVTHIRPSRVRKHVNLMKVYYHPARAYFVPDPDDPATAGCLLALLGSCVNVVSREHRTVVTIITDNLDFGHYPQGRGSNIGRACIAAAEALGRWPGGAE